MNILKLENIMRASKDHCSESIIDVHNASSVRRLSEILFCYMKQCVQKRFPSIEIMRDYKETGYPYGVFVERKGEYDALKNNVLFDSKITLRTENYDVSRIWVRGTSTLTLDAKDNSIVFIDCFDKTSVNVRARDGARVTVNLFGESECVNIEDDIVINQMDAEVYQ